MSRIVDFLAKSCQHLCVKKRKKKKKTKHKCSLKKKIQARFDYFPVSSIVSQATGTDLTLLGFKSTESYYGCKM